VRNAAFLLGMALILALAVGSGLGQTGSMFYDTYCSTTSLSASGPSRFAHNAADGHRTLYQWLNARRSADRRADLCQGRAVSESKRARVPFVKQGGSRVDRLGVGRTCHLPR